MAVPPDIARLIHEALVILGDEVDPEAIARSVRRLDHGLPAEDEFSVVCAWLGRCELVHKLDQQQTPPASRSRFQVPDLLAKFASSPPVLIEVKVCNDQTLSFKPDYRRRLAAYADLVGLPLLVAWKCRSIWTLFELDEIQLAKVNHNIRFGDAMKSNLLGVLAGDVSYVPAVGAGIHFTMAKEELEESRSDEESWTETWRLRMQSIDFTKGGGEPASLDEEVSQLFTTIDLEEAEHHDERSIRRSYFVGAQTGTQFAHRALVGLLAWESAAGGRPPWRSFLNAPQVVGSIGDFGAALSRAISQGVVTYVFHQLPTRMPAFLRDRGVGSPFVAG